MVIGVGSGLTSLMASPLVLRGRLARPDHPDRREIKDSKATRVTKEIRASKGLKVKRDLQDPKEIRATREIRVLA